MTVPLSPYITQGTRTLTRLQLPLPHSINPARGNPVALDGLFACLFFYVVIGPFEFRYVLLAESGLQGIEGQRWLASITPALIGHGRGENRTGRTKLLCKNIYSRPQNKPNQ